MERNEIIEKMLECKKGSYVKLKKVKDLGEGIIKESDMVIRLGIDYYNMKDNKDKERNGLKWGNYVEGLEGYVIEHINKKGEYNMYLRVYDNGNNVSSKSRYLLNGNEISKEEVISLIGENKLVSSKSDCYNINFNNIISLG